LYRFNNGNPHIPKGREKGRHSVCGSIFHCERKFPKKPTQTNARYLLAIADLIEKHADELATLETLNNGMAISLASGMAASAADLVRIGFYSNQTVGSADMPDADAKSPDLDRTQCARL